MLMLDRNLARRTRALFATATLVVAVSATAAAQPFAYVTCAVDVTGVAPGAVYVIDTTTNTVVTILPVGQLPHRLAITPDASRLFVPQVVAGAPGSPGALSIVDTASLTVTATPSVPQLGPQACSITPDGVHVYIANAGNDTVTVMDTVTFGVVATIGVADEPYDVTILPNGSRAYVSNFRTNTVSVIDTASRTVVTTIPTMAGPNGIRPSPDGACVYVVCSFANMLQVIDTATDTITATVSVGTNPNSLAVTPDGSRIYTGNGGTGPTYDGTISVVDSATLSVVTTIAGRNFPSQAAVTPDGARVYVTNEHSHDVTVIDVATSTVIATIPVGPYPRGIVMQNVPVCAVTSPASGTMLTGSFDIVADVHDPYGDPVDVTWDFSTDAGLTWALATADPASPVLVNPSSLGPTPLLGLTFRWDSIADGVGIAGTDSVRFRITVANGPRSSSCSADMLMVASAPVCVITSPAAGSLHSADVAIDYDIDDPGSDPVTTTFEHSTDGGATWLPCTTAAASTITNPDPPRATPSAGLVYVWDTGGDLLGAQGPQAVAVRIRVDDSRVASECSLTIDVDNQASCSIVGPPGGSLLIDEIDLVYDADHPLALPVDSSFEFSTDAGATWATATPAAGSPLANPDPARPTPFLSAVFTWDSGADRVGATGPDATLLRVSLSDGRGAASCQVGFDVDNTTICIDICGDCDASGIGPDLLDALRAAQIAVGVIVPTSPVPCCDVDSNGAVNILDSLFMARNAVGLPATIVCP